MHYIPCSFLQIWYHAAILSSSYSLSFLFNPVSPRPPHHHYSSLLHYTYLHSHSASDPTSPHSLWGSDPWRLCDVSWTPFGSSSPICPSCPYSDFHCCEILYQHSSCSPLKYPRCGNVCYSNCCLSPCDPDRACSSLMIWWDEEIGILPVIESLVLLPIILLSVIFDILYF